MISLGQPDQSSQLHPLALAEVRVGLLAPRHYLHRESVDALRMTSRPSHSGRMAPSSARISSKTTNYTDFAGRRSSIAQVGRDRLRRAAAASF